MSDYDRGYIDALHMVAGILAATSAEPRLTTDERDLIAGFSEVIAGTAAAMTAAQA